MLANVLVRSRCARPVFRASVARYSYASAERKVTMEAPVTVPGTAGAYAMYIFEEAYTAGGDKVVQRTESELNVLTWSVRKNTDWEVATNTPFLTPEKRNQYITEYMTSLGCSTFFIDLIVGLADRKDLGRLNQIRTDFEEIMRGYRKEVDVVLTTKGPLTPETLEFYKKNIFTSFLKEGDNMIFRHTVDPSIVNGYKVSVGKEEHDFTWNAQVAAAEVAKAQVSVSNAADFPFTPVVLKDVVSSLLDNDLFPAGAYKDI
eukprot:TRINITY_DN10398_c0_g1_i1.p1 TRINITY_DN10398_c0_g1~~TRINITY_DN10398_c0_g1_i1.p1  ORF type:complete len:260 (+),score=63.81 TRINITY_DN10398_c0_g1_i1:25-804(+)